MSISIFDTPIEKIIHFTVFGINKKLDYFTQKDNGIRVTKFAQYDRLFSASPFGDEET